MTSVNAQYNQIPPNKLWTNVAPIQSSIVDSNNVKVPWVVDSVAQVLKTPGAAVLRDMGKNVYLPDPTVPSLLGSQSTVLRKVQLVLPPGGTAQSSDASYYTGYIRLGGQTYGGGDAQPTAVARIN
jgi:hypothetical protein